MAKKGDGGQDVVVGIDLGTTNSEVAACLGEEVRVLGPERGKMLPSCVGFTPDGRLLVGVEARNQQILYPERTVRSVKRQMGSDVVLALGRRSFSPPEISALILRELAGWAADELGLRPRRAVITVPAYFSDAQRQATREAGELAELEVPRILNEPTAASLAYGCGAEPETVMVYDLGGGTFDVSIVRIDGEVTEVLASHGNNQLGGDDFDKLLVERATAHFLKEHRVDIARDHPTAFARLWWAAEETKKALSATPYARILEENLVVEDGRPLHLDLEISRGDYEDMIRPLLDTTMDSVTRAMDDARVVARDLDGILLVGGSTRTPLVQQMLEERSGLVPRQDLHPDYCVALGAGVMASRLGGQGAHRVLVDLTPYSFGISFRGELEGRPYDHCYKPIIRRNTALPVTRTESYSTSSPFQEAAEINIYQGDEPDALRNLKVGRFRIDGLTLVPEPNELLCGMRIDLDGILRVSATEKQTGRTKNVTIEDALEQRSPEELELARSRLADLPRNEPSDDAAEEAGGPTGPGDDAPPAVVLRGRFGDAAEERDDHDDDDGDDGDDDDDDEAAPTDEAEGPAAALLARSRGLLAQMHLDDREDAIELHERLAQALRGGDADALEVVCEELRELLYFVEGR